MALRRLRDPLLADEVAQETVLRVLTAMQRGDDPGPSSLGAYAHGVAQHVIADRFRQQRRRQSESLPSESGPRALVTPERDPLSMLITSEERERVREALRQLAEKDREILRLSFFDALKPAEIAARLAEPPERVRKRKSRALARLRAAFRALQKPDAASATAEADRASATALSNERSAER